MDSSSLDEEESIDVDDDEDGSDGIQPTPLAHRLRPRLRTGLLAERSSELEADADDDDESMASPGPSSRLRSREHHTNLYLPLSDEMPNRSIPGREAKKRAIEVLKAGESDEEDDMDVGEQGLVEDGDADGGESLPANLGRC